MLFVWAVYSGLVWHTHGNNSPTQSFSTDKMCSAWYPLVHNMRNQFKTNNWCIVFRTARPFFSVFSVITSTLGFSLENKTKPICYLPMVLGPRYWCRRVWGVVWSVGGKYIIGITGHVLTCRTCMTPVVFFVNKIGFLHHARGITSCIHTAHPGWGAWGLKISVNAVLRGGKLVTREMGLFRLRLMIKLNFAQGKW